jgi:CotH kinase protein/Lamin Tail Domain/Fn3 associated
MNNTTRSLSLLLLVSLASPLYAGRYPAAGAQAFVYPDNTTNLADGTTLSSSFLGSFAKVTGNATTDPTKPYLQLANKSFSGNSTTWRIPDLDTGTAIQSFDATFLVRMQRTSTGAPGSGWSLNFGAIPAAGNGSGDIGFSMANGMTVSFDTFPDSLNDFPSIQVYCNNSSVGNFVARDLTETTPVTGGNFTLTNPVTGGTTAAIQYNASATSVQSAMRAVAGWNTVTVTGTAGNWTVNRGAVGSYADPTGNGANLTSPLMTPTVTVIGGTVPGGGTVVITNTQDGTPAQNEIWTIGHVGRGFLFTTTFRAVQIHWDYDGLDLSFGGQAIFTNLPTPGFVPSAGNRFAFCASAVGGAQDTFIDDVVLSTGPAVPPDTGGPVISEFMAENQDTLEDEDMDSPDWIEIYNGQNAPANLGGYKLSNGTLTWVFPSVTLAPYGHLVVYASGKDRTANPALLHTNFTLLKTGGTLTLRNPADAVLSTWTYPNQAEDYSYGLKYQGGGAGFLDTASPGAPTLYNFIVAPNGPAEDVEFSREGGLITGSTALSAAAPLAPGSVIRYTTDNSNPTEASALFPASLNVTNTTNVRARVFTPGFLPGKVSSRTFLLLDGSLTNYNGSGQPFQSHLPLIVFDSFGVNVDAVTDQAQPRPHRYTYAVVVDKDVSGWASITSPVYDFQGRSGTHVRGDSSGGFPQKSWAWETWDNNNEDKDASILGMPAESDWALHGPYTDKSFFRNFIAYSKMREVRGGVDGHAMRVRLVEVIFNQDPGQPVSYTDYRGVYVLMERIKRGKDRVDIARLNSLATNPALISGGYIFRRDRTSADGNTPLPVGMHSHTPNILNSAQTTWLSNHITAFNNALNGGNFTDPVLGYAPYIDVDSFIYQWWFVEICKQIDGYRLSTYFYKDRGNTKIVAGPIWDFNLSLGNADYLAGDQPTGWYWNQTDSYWWARLRQDPNYETRNWDIYWKMRRSLWATPSINAYIDGLAAQALNGSTTPVTNNMSLAAGQPSTLENAAMRHYREYPILGAYVWPNAVGYASRIYYNSNGNAATGEIDWMKNWLAQRMLWLDDQYTSGGLIYRPPNFSNYGGNVPAGTQVTITPYTGTAPSGFSYAQPGTIYYTLDGTDPRPSSSGGGPAETVIFTSGAPCKWLVPSAGNGGFALTAGPGAQQWTDYTAPPNIANWTSSVTGVGYDNNPDYLPLIGAGSNTGSQMFNINATCYVRVEFNIADAAALANIGTLRLGMKYEDGFRAYLNGVQVAGRNDTHASMTSDPSTAVSSAVRDETSAVAFEEIDISGVGIPALRVGLNVIAIHCLNGVDATSSDLLMVPKLAYLPPGAGGGGGNGTVYSGPITLNTSSTLKARLFANSFWSPITSADYVVNAVPANSANLVITELMYNPSPATSTESQAGFGDNDFEYVELRNISGANVDLTGCKFTTGITFDFSVADPGTLTLPPGGRIVVVANSSGFSTRYGAVPGLRTAGQFTGSLSNDGELITLIGATGAIIAQFTYGTAEPWPVASDGLGYSLVLNNAASSPAYGTPGSWRSSAAPGGTPGGGDSAPFTGSFTGDSDADGYVDFLEYATGSDSSSNASQNAPALDLAPYTVSGVPGTYLRFIFRRSLNADGFTITPELSTNLPSWSSAPADITYVGSSHNGDGTASVEYRSTQPASALPTASMRLKVTSVP